jgi:hypothetical protein
MSKVVINGANKPTLTEEEERPPRFEIRDFVKDEKQFSLYIQALRNYPHSLLILNFVDDKPI